MEATTIKGGALTGQERRAEIMNILRQSTMPLSGAALGKQLGVSRQVVVQISRSCVNRVKRSMRRTVAT